MSFCSELHHFTIAKLLYQRLIGHIKVKKHTDLFTRLMLLSFRGDYSVDVSFSWHQIFGRFRVFIFCVRAGGRLTTMDRFAPGYPTS